MLSLDWDVLIKPYIESKRCADALASSTCQEGFNLIVYGQCPAHINSFL
jgi:hypothetical protein